MFCAQWTSCRINKDAVIYGTKAEVSCDDGFMFASHQLVEPIECIAEETMYPEAKWNISQLECQGSSLAASVNIRFGSQGSF